MDAAYILVPLIIAVAFFGESVFGFGGGLISVPLISLLLGVKEAATIVLVFQTCMGLLIFKSYKRIDWKDANPLTLGALIGVTIGTLLLSRASTSFLQLFLAVSIFTFLIKTIWFNGFTLGHESSKIAATGAGFGGGIFQGLVGMGGPILTMYLSVASPNKLAMRATLIYVAFISSIVRLGISIPKQLFTDQVIHFSLISIPSFLIAIFVGQNIHHKVSDYYYKKSIELILAFAALTLVCKSLF
jgi:uncharacterized membrane protein YfcA